MTLCTFIKAGLLGGILLAAAPLQADDLEIYGFMQVSGSSQTWDEDYGASLEADGALVGTWIDHAQQANAIAGSEMFPWQGLVGLKDNTRNDISFNLQQLNVILKKRFNRQWSSFVNFEVVENYKTDYAQESEWGSFSVQEAFVRYAPSARWTFKFGKFVPTFGNFYEIYNRTPLQPYLFRPLIFEKSVGGILPPEDYLPNTMAAQVSGTLRTGIGKLDYALFLGNSEESYFAENGRNDTDAKCIGGRFGIRRGLFKAGVSGSYDYDRLDALDLGNDVVLAIDYKVPRMRYGVDFSGSAGPVSFVCEGIFVVYDLDSDQQAVVDASHAAGTSADNTLDKSFFYAHLQYDAAKWFVYGDYDFVNDGIQPWGKDGVNALIGGGGIRLTDSITWKFQVAQYSYEVSVPHPLFGAPDPLAALGGDLTPVNAPAAGVYKGTILDVQTGISIAF